MSSHRQRIAARRARVLQRAIVEPLEGRTLLSNPIVLDAMERELRDNFIAPTANSADLNFAPEPYEHEYTEPRLVYGFDQPVSGLDNQSHVLTSLYQVVLIENPAYPLQDVPFKVWTGPGGSTLSSLLLDSTDGVTWTGSDGGVTATLTEHEEFIWDHRLSVTTPTGSVTWKLSWNGYDSGGNIYPDSSSITGDGADYFIESLGGPQYSTSHTAGNVVAPPDISAPVFSPDGMTASFLFPNGPLPNGYYDSVLSSGGITNSSGEHLDGDLTLAGENDFIYSFFVLAGDANHDGVVNIDDYGVIDGNVGQSGSVFGFFNGDFNYDNLINVDDYGIIDSTYATQLPAPLTGANQLSASAAYQREDVDNFIRLQWIAPEGVSDIDSWGLWRSSDGGVTFTLLTNDIPGEARSFDDIGDGQGLPEGTKYTYRLRAFSNELGYSETTNKAWSVTNLPGPITATITDVTTTSMKLNWPDNAANEDGYEVWQERPDTYPLLIATLPANATSYTIAGLDPNTQYTFRVNAFTDATGSLPASATATTLDGPVEPTALTATLVGPTSLTLNWTDKSWNETGFEIESSTDGVNFALIATPGVNATTLPLSGLTPDTQYTFRIRAVGNASSPWMTLGVRTLPVGVPIKPSNATASTNAASSDSEWWKATLTWQDNSSDETGFTIQQLQSDGTWSTIATVGPDVETYTMNDLDAATDYTWRVLADGSGGSSGGGSGGLGGSAPANQGSATTPIAYGQIFDSEYEQWFLSGGIQRQWGGAAETYADGSLIRGTGDGAVTLTLSNLPKHGARSR